jgi:hypothetical protein
MPTKIAPKETEEKVTVLGRLRKVFLEGGKKWVTVKGKLMRLTLAREAEKAKKAKVAAKAAAKAKKA